MINAGVKEVKNNLSRYLARVKNGEDVLITDRGKPIARIVKERQQPKTLRVALADLAQKGLVMLPTKSIDKEGLSAIAAPGRPVSEIVTENRR